MEKRFDKLEDKSQINEIIDYFQKRNFYYKKNSFLSMKLIESNLSLNNLSRDEINIQLIDIRREIENLRTIENTGNLEEQNYISNDHSTLEQIKNELNEKREQYKRNEEYREAIEELKKLKNELNVLKTQKIFQIWKEKLLNEMNRAMTDLPLNEMIKKVNALKIELESLITISEEKMFSPKNNIDWIVPGIDKINEESKKLNLYEIILKYNSSIEII